MELGKAVSTWLCSWKSYSPDCLRKTCLFSTWRMSTGPIQFMHQPEDACKVLLNAWFTGCIRYIGISCLVSLLHYSIPFLLYCNTFLLTNQNEYYELDMSYDLLVSWLPRTCVFYVEWLIRYDHYFRRDDATCQLCQFPIHALHQDSLILIYALHPLDQLRHCYISLCSIHNHFFLFFVRHRYSHGQIQVKTCCCPSFHSHTSLSSNFSLIADIVKWPGLCKYYFQLSFSWAKHGLIAMLIHSALLLSYFHCRGRHYDMDSCDEVQSNHLLMSITFSYYWR